MSALTWLVKTKTATTKIVNTVWCYKHVMMRTCVIFYWKCACYIQPTPISCQLVDGVLPSLQNMKPFTCYESHVFMSMTSFHGNSSFVCMAFVLNHPDIPHVDRHYRKQLFHMFLTSYHLLLTKHEITGFFITKSTIWPVNAQNCRYLE